MINILLTLKIEYNEVHNSIFNYTCGMTCSKEQARVEYTKEKKCFGILKS